MSLEQMKALVESSRAVRFSIEGREALYSLMVRVLKKQRYGELSREQRGIVRGFLAKVTGRSRAQVTRLIGQWMEGRTIQSKRLSRRRFPTRYKEEDARLLAEVDAAHEDLSGPAVRRILRREYEVFGRQEYQRLASISVSHLYNLRRSKAYRKVRVRVEHTRASQVNIGERRKPQPLGRPGYLRVDTGASRTSGWQIRALPYQCCGHGDAMAGGRVRQNDFRTAPVAGAQGDAASDSVRHPRLSLRQRQ